ncbi:MAG: hypothetical protein WBD51_21430 [Burkholderiaceae bacterium]
MNEMDMLREDRRRLAEDLKLVVRDTENILRHKVADAGQGYTEARDRLERTLQDAKGQLEALERTATDTARTYVREADAYAHRHPWETSGAGIGIGVGIGLLLGLIAGRR